MCNGRPMDVHWTGGQAWSIRVECAMDVPWTSIGSRTSLVSEDGMCNGRPLDRWTSLVNESGMCNGRPMDVHWTGGQAWSMRVGCAMVVPWTSIGQVDKPGQ